MDKIVDFRWCQNCEHYLRQKDCKRKLITEEMIIESEQYEPCFTCLHEPSNADSRRPVYFKGIDESKWVPIPNEYEVQGK